jgi:hypothetical protein
MYKAIKKQFIIAPGLMIYGLSTIKRPGQVFFSDKQIELIEKYYNYKTSSSEKNEGINFSQLSTIIAQDRNNPNRAEFIEKFNNESFNTEYFNPDDKNYHSVVFVKVASESKIELGFRDNSKQRLSHMERMKLGQRQQERQIENGKSSINSNQLQSIKKNALPNNNNNLLE